MFAKYQCGFRKSFNVHIYVMTIIEKWRQSLGVGGDTGALLTNLSKAFLDCIYYDL